MKEVEIKGIDTKYNLKNSKVIKREVYISNTLGLNDYSPSGIIET